MHKVSKNNRDSLNLPITMMKKTFKSGIIFLFAFMFAFDLDFDDEDEFILVDF